MTTEPYPADPVATTPPQRYPRTRAIRGLLRRVRAHDCTGPHGRRLIGRVAKNGPPGTCVWCKEPADTPRRWWHQDCVQAYFVAIGTRVKPDVPKGRRLRCDECGEFGDEIDHRYALALARQDYHDGKRHWWKAWTRQNLRYLCDGCHRRKTNADLRAISEAKRARQDRDAGIMALPFA